MKYLLPIIYSAVQWTNAAHLNGVQILGTFITEWDEGSQECKLLLENKQFYADQLVEIAKYYRFDGWFLNIENPIPPEKCGELAEFISYLKVSLQKHVSSDSLVIWYDSVLFTNGQLKWQNALNSSNKVIIHVRSTHLKIYYLIKGIF